MAGPPNRCYRERDSHGAGKETFISAWRGSDRYKP
jgi:hypothetical protein